MVQCYYSPFRFSCGATRWLATDSLLSPTALLLFSRERSSTGSNDCFVVVLVVVVVVVVVVVLVLVVGIFIL
jgi:hypothetical protein